MCSQFRVVHLRAEQQRGCNAMAEQDQPCPALLSSIQISAYTRVTKMHALPTRDRRPPRNLKKKPLHCSWEPLKDFITSYPERDAITSYSEQDFVASFSERDSVASYPERDFVTLYRYEISWHFFGMRFSLHLIQNKISLHLIWKVMLLQKFK